jgi:hypothetical protein
MTPKYFIGPMSKNVVDTIIKFCEENKVTMGFIPSRRQIENTGGYVNNWTTSEFSEYVNKKTNRILLQRDHGGPGQGIQDDDGIESLKEDCKYLDYIHIDPWKQKDGDLMEGIITTKDLIQMCYDINPNIKFEIGTEQSIKPFEVNELETMIRFLKNDLPEKVFNNIRYLVIQSGTSLKGNTQTGDYSSDRLKQMIKLAKKYNLLTKEHNGDYISVSTIKEKFNLGLDAINIAPEFGLIETQTYINEIKDKNILKIFFQICYESKKWTKWVDKDFDPFVNKIELIKICGHYVLSNPKFLSEIKLHFPDIDNKIKFNIKNKLNELYR